MTKLFWVLGGTSLQATGRKDQADADGTIAAFHGGFDFEFPETHFHRPVFTLIVF